MLFINSSSKTEFEENTKPELEVMRKSKVLNSELAE